MEMLADGQKVMAATAQMLAGGWKGGSPFEHGGETTLRIATATASINHQ